jgi:hypothetical protein
MIPDVRGWTHVVGTRSGSLLFYDNMAGVAARAQVNENLHYSYITDHTKLSHAWTHLTSVANLVFFYDSTNPKTGSNAYVVDLSAGSYMPYKYVDGVDSGFEQVVGASNGGLLFLDKETGSAVIGDLVWVDHGAEDPTGKFVLGAQVPNLPWTQVGAN